MKCTSLNSCNGALCWYNVWLDVWRVKFIVDVCYVRTCIEHIDYHRIDDVIFLAEQSFPFVPPNSPGFSTLSLQDALLQCAIHPTVSYPSSPRTGAQYVFVNHASSRATSSIFLSVDSFEEPFLGLQQDIFLVFYCPIGAERHRTPLSIATLSSFSLLLVSDCHSDLCMLINAGHSKGEYIKIVSIEAHH